jgi:hypothetical protein
VKKITMKSKNDQFSDEEAQRRFISAVKAALNTKPTPLRRKASSKKKRSKPKR